jgi:tetratricopeptide (TPR) repeat protein
MRLVKLFFVFISGLSIYAHYLNNESSELQYILYQDMNSGNYNESSTARFNVVNFDFPNLSLSSIPVKSIVAKYYFLGGEFNKALEYLQESDKVNPYLMYSESIRSEIYEYLAVEDSLLYYAEKAFTGIKHNDKHFFYLARAYARSDRFEAIDSIFKLVEKGYNPRIWNIYFSTLLSNESKISEYAKGLAKEAVSIFPPDEFPKIELVSKYVYFGTERIDKAIDTDFAAQKAYSEGNYAEAAKLYAKASEFNPTDYTLFENAGLNYYLINEYDKSLEYLNIVIDSMNPGTGKSEFIASTVFIKKNDKVKACEYAKLASELDYPGSYGIIAKYCNN